MGHYNTARPHRSLDLRPPRPATRRSLVQPGTVSLRCNESTCWAASSTSTAAPLESPELLLLHSHLAARRPSSPRRRPRSVKSDPRGDRRFPESNLAGVDG